MRVNIDGLRQNLADSFGEVVNELQSSRIYKDQLLVSGERLEKRLNNLRNDIVIICAIINPATGKSILDDEAFNVASFDFDKMLDDE